MTDQDELLLTSQLSLHPCCLSYRVLPSRPRSRRTKPKDHIYFIPFDQVAVHPRLRGRAFLVSTNNHRDLWRDSIFWPSPEHSFRIFSQSIRFVRFDGKSVNADLRCSSACSENWIRPEVAILRADQKECALWVRELSARFLWPAAESRPLTGYEFSEQAQSTHFVFSANHTFIFLPKSVNRCWPKGTRGLWTIMIQKWIGCSTGRVNISTGLWRKFHWICQYI